MPDLILVAVSIGLISASIFFFALGRRLQRSSDTVVTAAHVATRAGRPKFQAALAVMNGKVRRAKSNISEAEYCGGLATVTRRGRRVLSPQSKVAKDHIDHIAGR